MFKKLKHGTTVMRESFRKHEGRVALREDFTPAAEHFKSIQQTITGFIDDAQRILKALPALSKQATAFAVGTAQVFTAFPDDDRAVSVQATVLTEHMADFTTSHVQEAGDTILRPLRDLHNRINELAALQAEHKSSFLILESNKAKLDTFLKDEAKNALKIEEYTEKVRLRAARVEELEEEFIGRMDAIWANRFEVLNRPLMGRMGILMEMGGVVRSDVETLAIILGSDIVEADYPAGAIPEKGRK
jgi:hypothetical protein